MRRLGRAVETLYPGYFNLVMATGIVSNALILLSRPMLSDALLAIAAAAYAVLVVLLALRASLHPRLLWADLVDPEHVFMFFTFVAGSDVLGLGLQLRGHDTAATVLWLVALGAWVALGYFSFSVLIFVNVDEEAEIVHGGWLIAIVATESLAILGVVLAPRFGSAEDPALITAYSLWGIGVVLYAIFVTLFMRRIFFVRVDPNDMRPLFWVVMGAAAIATNAGSTLVESAPHLTFLRGLRPFVDGATLVIWAWATWWIPLLVILGLWRHVVRRHPIRYEPAYWNVVFPLGMYTVATWRLSLAADYPALQTVSRVMVWVAFAAWLAAMAGLLSSAWPRGARLHSARPPAARR